MPGGAARWPPLTCPTPAAWEQILQLVLPAAATLHSLPLLCGFAARSAFFAHVRPVPPLLQDVRPAGPSPHSEPRFSIPLRLVSRGCTDAAGVYSLSSNWNRSLEVPATRLPTSPLAIGKGRL